MSEDYKDFNIYKATSDEEKEEFAEQLRRNYFNQEFNQYPEELRQLIYSTEIEKPEFLENFVNQVNEKLSQLFLSLGLSYKSTPLNHIHVIPMSTQNAIADHNQELSFIRGVATADTVNQSLLVCIPKFDMGKNSEENAYAKLYFLRMITHEMVHGAAFQSFNIAYRFGGAKGLYPHRGGIHLQHRAESVFHYLNEGLTDQITNDIFFEILKNENILKSLADENNSYDDVLKAIENRNVPDRLLTGPYFMQIDVLNYLYQEMATANPNRYPTVQDAKKHFFSAYFGGKIIDLFREIRTIFGKKGLKSAQTSVPYKVIPELKRQRIFKKMFDPILEIFGKKKL